jgi:hypothetical protein
VVVPQTQRCREDRALIGGDGRGVYRSDAEQLQTNYPPARRYRQCARARHATAPNWSPLSHSMRSPQARGESTDAWNVKSRDVVSRRL